MAGFILEIEDGVARLILDRPEIRNAFDDRLIADLTEALQGLGERGDLRALVLTGKGKAFSAGADLNWMQAMAGYSREENFADSQKLGRLMHVLYHLPFTTIAAVNGSALGGGVGLVACSDIAIAVDDAFFALSEARLGLIPAVISPFVIAAIGARQAHRYFQTAERFSAVRACEIGLVHEIVDAEELNMRVELLLKEILANGPQAVRASKALLRDVSGAVINDDLLDETARRIAEIRVSDEGQRGLSAFLQKRKPDWTER
jgi:methylglutaconyl-CoA hydratase